jgi:glycerol 2-dehydrogenase (NADP+)
VARESVVLAKSVTPERITANRENLVDLDASDVAAIKKYSAELTAKKQLQRYVYPPFGVDFGFPDK